MDAALSQLQADDMCILLSEQTRTAEAGALKDSLDPEVQAKIEAEQRANDRKAAMHQLHAAAVVHTARGSCTTVRIHAVTARGVNTARICACVHRSGYCHHSACSCCYRWCC
eukprot:10830-Heterococcus_DN1.PRE.1